MLAKVKLRLSSVPCAAVPKSQVASASAMAKAGLGSSAKLLNGRAAESMMLPSLSVQNAIRMLSPSGS